MKLPVRAFVPMLNPAEIAEAKINGLIKPDEGIALLEKYMAEEFPENKIRNLIKDMSEATDLKYSKGAGFYTTRNWQAVKHAIDYVLKLRNLVQTEIAGQRPPTKVIFNTVVYSNQKVERANKSHIPGHLSEAMKRNATEKAKEVHASH
jgi:hypothetical protein